MIRTISISVLLITIAVIAFDLMRIKKEKTHVETELNVLVEEAIELDRKLKSAGTVYVGDVLSEEDLFLFMTDGRISVIESPGTRFEGRGDPLKFSKPPPEEGRIESVLIVRTWANNRFRLAIVYRGEEVYRTHSLPEAVQWFLKSGL